MKGYTREDKKRLCKKHYESGFDGFSLKDKIALAEWQVEILDPNASDKAEKIHRKWSVMLVELRKQLRTSGFKFEERPVEYLSEYDILNLHTKGAKYYNKYFNPFTLNSFLELLSIVVCFLSKSINISFSFSLVRVKSLFCFV